MLAVMESKHSCHCDYVAPLVRRLRWSRRVLVLMPFYKIMSLASIFLTVYESKYAASGRDLNQTVVNFSVTQPGGLQKR